jgi:hypothetical protein
MYFLLLFVIFVTAVRSKPKTSSIFFSVAIFVLFDIQECFTQSNINCTHYVARDQSLICGTVRDFLFRRPVLIITTQPPNQWVPVALSLGVKLMTHLHLVPGSKTRGSIPPVPQYAFMALYSVKAQGQLYLYPASSPMCIGGSFLKLKLSDGEDGNSPLCSTDSENAWSFISTRDICFLGNVLENSNNFMEGGLEET